MSKEMIEQINKVKNFGQFLNEGKLNRNQLYDIVEKYFNEHQDGYVKLNFEIEHNHRKLHFIELYKYDGDKLNRQNNCTKLLLYAGAAKFKQMKINVNYCSTKHYDKTNITQWMWMFKKYKYVKGFIIRIFGMYINVRESNATEKLIKMAQGSTCL